MHFLQRDNFKVIRHDASLATIMVIKKMLKARVRLILSFKKGSLFRDAL
jgi:hypothetical protein